MFELNGKVAVVTGASSGLGKDAALAYAKEGVNVALLARRVEKIEEIAKEVESLGVKAIAIKCDVAKEEEVKVAIETIVNEFGRIDILLNNAGVTAHGGVDSLSEEEWNKVMDINVKGIYLVSKYVIPVMKEQNYGKVINISSVNAILGEKGGIFIRHAYNTSKAAVLGLTKAMGASYAQYGITVNAICPGLFESEMTERTLFTSQKFLEKYNTLCPASRPGKKGELNGTIFYFSSDASSYVTGQYIVVDGGISIV
ncbi:SDR family NAD(P)-dependent oxidoreductase [Clostridium cellulovorans]|uniref:Short-chain dehydrogenase/reductase SDR n=1 Tax=Clostridium cellulovorans (strain ATCC 35296 / DSM 3052 / OCM 3 / 743B) TaxID=573061 RepID=D9SNH5_CLOC7|nr:glucose 1-dehydrogenase [Clostridium cellulovorans]ADL53967.1 short-chain dehydrogenase/reductase SDR [Clostridium cellulovorans 743B]